MNNRQVLDELIQKFEVAEATKSKELRITLSDVHRYHLALTKLLLQNSEIQQNNIILSQKNESLKKYENTEVVADGGTFLVIDN